MLIDGTKIAGESLKGAHPGQFFTVDYPIPSTLTAGKSTVTVKFQAAPKKLAGGVFGCAVLKDR